MVDKGLNIKKECDVHVIDVHVPHVPRGQLQILRKDFKKTNDISKLGIMAEQVMQKFKSLISLLRNCHYHLL